MLNYRVKKEDERPLILLPAICYFLINMCFSFIHNLQHPSDSTKNIFNLTKKTICAFFINQWYSMIYCLKDKALDIVRNQFQVERALNII